MTKEAKISDMIGMTIESVEGGVGSYELHFKMSDGNTFEMYHQQDCCEDVSVEDIIGDLSDVVGSPLVMAEEATSTDNPEGYTPNKYQDSFTWTFYKLGTTKGSITIRWYGESTGFYSESVDLVHITTEEGG